MTQIVALSWEHDAIDPNAFLPIKINGEQFLALVVAFNKRVRPLKDPKRNLFNHIFELQVPRPFSLFRTAGPAPTHGYCWCPLLARMEPVNCGVAGEKVKADGLSQASDELASGLALLLKAEEHKQFLGSPQIQFRVILRCDFIVDGDGKAVDGEFTRGELPSGDRPAPRDPASKSGIQGGTFVSWFRMSNTSEPLFNANMMFPPLTGPGPSPPATGDIIHFSAPVPRAALMSLRGIGAARADRLRARLAEGPIRTWEELHEATGMNETAFANFRRMNKNRIRLAE